MQGRIHYENPFVTPIHQRDPVRRLRGRLAAPVTIWTTGSGTRRTGLTMSSVLVAEGEPSSVLGLVSDTTDLFERIGETGTFVMHVLDEDHHILADVFAGLRPAPGGMFTGLEVEDSEWGPVLTQFKTRAFCKVWDTTPAGYQVLVRGAIEQLELADLTRPLTYFRGRYRSLT
jgi:flavin reductase (DIM6/NTAB) family NADH-FMN oxidoreductase RutF